MADDNTFSDEDEGKRHYLTDIQAMAPLVPVAEHESIAATDQETIDKCHLSAAPLRESIESLVGYLTDYGVSRSDDRKAFPSIDFAARIRPALVSAYLCRNHISTSLYTLLVSHLRHLNTQQVDGIARLGRQQSFEANAIAHQSDIDGLRNTLRLLAIETNCEAEPSLSDLQLNILVALYDCDAFDPDSRKSQDILASPSGTDSPESLKKPFSQLRKLGLIQSRQGRGGGSWLTPLGKARAEKFQETRKPQE